MNLIEDDGEKKVSRYTSKLTESSLVLGARVVCNRTCRYFSVCPIRALAQPTGNCLLKTLPQTDIQSFVNLFLEQRDGLIHEMLLALWHYKQSSNVMTNKRDAKEYFNMLTTLHKEIYGSAKGSEAIKELSVVVTNVGMEQEGRAKQIRSEHEEIDGIILDADVYDPEDPESLFNSDIIDDEIVKDK